MGRRSPRDRVNGNRLGPREKGLMGIWKLRKMRNGEWREEARG